MTSAAGGSDLRCEGCSEVFRVPTRDPRADLAHLPGSPGIGEVITPEAIHCVADGADARRCPQCGRTFRMNHSLAGKTIRCRGCKLIFKVEATRPTRAERRDAFRSAQPTPAALSLDLAAERPSLPPIPHKAGRSFDKPPPLPTATDRSPPHAIAGLCRSLGQQDNVATEPTGSPQNDPGVRPNTILTDLWPRIGARAIDCILAATALRFLPLSSSDQGSWLPIFTYCIGSAFILWRWQATPGLLAIQAKVVDATTHSPVTFRQCLARSCGELLSALPLGAGFVWAAFDARRQTWHDKMANTVVVKACPLDFEQQSSVLSRRTESAAVRESPHSFFSPEPASSTLDAGDKEPKTGIQAVLSANPLYLHAKRVNEGMHRFHKFGKALAYACVGFVIWTNDVADRWVGWLCTKVDTATQSTTYQWTMGWVTPPPPAISPAYNNYNLIVTVVGILGIAWASRWFFWTVLMLVLEEEKKYQKGTLPTLMMLISGVWAVEYAIAGGIANSMFASICPFSIPWWPSPLAFLMAFASVAVVWYLESTRVPNNP